MFAIQSSPVQPTYTVPDARYAVLLNPHARRVTPRRVAAIRQIVPRGQLHLTESREHAREVLHRCVEDEVRTVFAGGGDGTIIDTINALERWRGDTPQLPSVGVLRLGTGNALAHWLGSGGAVRDLRRWQGGRIARSVPVSMVEAEGTVFPFAGLGHDAAVLNDYNQLRESARGTWWQGLTEGLKGYLAAGLLKTVPNYLRRGNARVRVVNIGRPAQRIGPDGREVGPVIEAGEVLYRGSASLVSAATTPLYGYGMRMFPHATRRAGRFQLRVIDMTAAQAVANMIPCWRGTLQHPGLHDFYADRVRVFFEDALPYQLGGDASGYRREMTFSLHTHQVNLVAQA